MSSGSSAAKKGMLTRALLLALWLCSPSAGAAAAPAAPVTVWLAGDSTMAPKRPEKRPETGWGEYLEAQFQPGAVIVDNRAVNGRSTRTFIAEGRWQSLLEAMRPGDYVFIQFGHNDESVEKRDRHTPPADYRRNLSRWVREVRERRALPVLLTPVARRRFDAAGHVVDSHGEYPGIVRSVAAEQQVPLIDLQRSSEAALRDAGELKSRQLYLWLSPGETPNYPEGLRDDTHFSPTGAQRMAEAAVAELRALDLPLGRLLKPAPGSAVSANASR